MVKLYYKIGDDVMDDINRDIIQCSYYVIKYFNDRGGTVTNLKIQKLMYFYEGLYMILQRKNYLFNDEFYAWTFGPVCEKLYHYYKKFESEKIELTQEEENIANSLPKANKTLTEHLYKLFWDFNASELVLLTHRKDSPWSEVYDEDNDYYNKIIVDKKKTRDWLYKLFN